MGGGGGVGGIEECRHSQKLDSSVCLIHTATRLFIPRSIEDTQYTHIHARTHARTHTRVRLYNYLRVRYPVQPCLRYEIILIGNLNLFQNYGFTVAHDAKMT